MIAVTEDQRRDMIVRCARDCEGALRSADGALRVGTVRERFTTSAFHLKSAQLFAEAAFTWAKREVVP